MRRHVDAIAARYGLSRELAVTIQAVSAVLPFRTNEYVLENLIDWSRVPEDPIYQLTFPQAGMLDPADFAHLCNLVRRGASRTELSAEARKIQRRLNPHPGGQRELNVPDVDGEPVRGMQHKYRETVLFFPTQGQTCHAYCTYCFRWAQFVGLDDLRFASNDPQALKGYLQAHPEVRSVLITGGDPLVMRTAVLRRYVEPLLDGSVPSVTSIRFGTKAPAYWPHRFTDGENADDLLRLLEEIRAAGIHPAVMAHYCHPRELGTEAARLAVRRITGTGAAVRCQAPLVRHVNDRADAWAELWRRQVSLGAVPYYMFVERDTGPKHYFEVPLARALEIFADAYRTTSGLARTVRGPSMSATPGKVLVDGVAEIAGERVFVLKMLQGRDPDWVNTVFFARYDADATWLTDLRPAFGEQAFFFERGLGRLRKAGSEPPWWPAEAREGGLSVLDEASSFAE